MRRRNGSAPKPAATVKNEATTRIPRVSRHLEHIQRLAMQVKHTVKASGRKLGLSFWHYLGDRLGISNKGSPFNLSPPSSQDADDTGLCP